MQCVTPMKGLPRILPQVSADPNGAVAPGNRHRGGTWEGPAGGSTVVVPQTQLVLGPGLMFVLACAFTKRIALASAF